MAAFKLPKGLVLPLGGTAVAIALSLASFFEGTRYTAYQDVGGVWTICDGHTGPDVHPGMVATKAQCDAYRAADVAVANAAVHRLITVPLTSMCEAGLTDFTLNTGSGTLAKSTPRRLFNAGDYEGGAKALELYHYAAGRDCRLSASQCAGIVVRRAVERWLCQLSPTP
ncbi:lysozyme [Pseudomonas putida]|uniref:lysozyme n=1 Tax=Pseudomonas putida TaxID=303 RepID=UPI0018E692A3|nr:lysozyme [Pseudomonas putida]MBI6944221.1 lysozyme [Pseudomonas putida]MBI6960322.1 lysozyme [Pseudomonas putida]